MNSALGLCAALLLTGPTGMTMATPCPPPCVGYEMRTVICYRPEWRDEKVPCLVQKVSYRQEVTPVKTSVWVCKPFEQRVRTACYVPVPKIVEREVWTCVMVPAVYIDPCLGCCSIICQPCWISRRVGCTDYDYRMEEREQSVIVWRWVEQPTVVDQVRWIPVVTQEQSWTLRRYCVMVPYQATVCVPCCP